MNTKVSTCLILFGLLQPLHAEEYGFDFEELEQFEKKAFEQNGYLKAATQAVQDEFLDKNYFIHDVELNHQSTYTKDNLSIHTDLSALYQKEDQNSENNFVINQAYLSYQSTQNNITTQIGKKTLRWGKGYVYNPVALLDRTKDPLDPEGYKEGYTLADMQYIKSLNNPILKNYALNLVYLPINKNINRGFTLSDKNSYAAKLYGLVYDSDIDLIYIQNEHKIIGMDFSTNLLENLELHFEHAKILDQSQSTSSLLGIKYVNTYDTTFIVERYKKLEQKEFFYTKISQKEPFELVYSNLYFKYLQNLSDQKSVKEIGMDYDLKNGFTLLSYVREKDESKSAALEVKYYF
jgi:hypothetical protein